MTAYTIMKAGKVEDDMIPKLAIHAFREAFKQACASSIVVYVKDQQLVQRQPNGQESVMKDVSAAYRSAQHLPKTLTRKKKLQTVH